MQRFEWAWMSFIGDCESTVESHKVQVVGVLMICHPIVKIVKCEYSDFDDKRNITFS
jgi:hypothetical protein